MNKKIKRLKVNIKIAHERLKKRGDWIGGKEINEEQMNMIIEKINEIIDNLNQN